MKTKTIYSLLTASLFLGFTACKKDYKYTCKCKFADGKTYNTTHYSGVTETEAEARCASQEQSIRSKDAVAAQSVTCAME